MSSKSERYTPEDEPLNPEPGRGTEQNEGGPRAEYSEPHFFDTRLGKRVKKILGGLLGALAIALSVIYGDADASEDTADQFVAAVNTADAEALNALIHVDALAARVIEGMDPDAQQRDQYLFQLRATARTLGTGLAAQFAAGNTLARLVSESEGGPLVRITMRQGNAETSHNYLMLRTHPDGRIEDWYDYALAMWASDSLRFSSASVISAYDLARMMFRDSEATEHATTMRLVAAHLSLGDSAGAYRSLLLLPEEIREERTFATFAAVLSRAVGMDEYRRSLAHVARHYGDVPELQFMLIDHYMLESKFTEMLDAVAVLEGQVGTDEVVLNNRCAAMIGLERYSEALETCDAVLAIDPKNDTALWTRVRLGLTQKNASLVVESLLLVEEATGAQMDLHSLSQLDAYADVRDQPAFREMLAQRAR